MTASKNDYFFERRKFLEDLPGIINKEKQYTEILLDEVIYPSADNIYNDFCNNAKELLPFWKNYPPEQRGRMPTGQSIPWIEVGEKTVSFHLIKTLSKVFPNITFPGLPTGGDIRFATNDALIHIDIKLTGPNDNPDEVVVPPNQVSGSGEEWNENGILNTSWPIYYKSMNSKRINYFFQPKLPPFYFLNGKAIVCLTFFLKVVYSIQEFGVHPLNYFELACVPNGLLLFLPPYLFADTQGLLIAGKDDKTKNEASKRIRIRLTPLSSIDPWRSIKVVFKNGKWEKELRKIIQ